MFRLKPGQYVYRQGISASPKLYFIMYGSLVLHTAKHGQFGSIMCIGHTLGEESLFSLNKGQTIKRTESLISSDNSCVLQIDLDTYAMMRMQKHTGAGGNNIIKDYQTLNYILESHYYQKNEWRDKIGAFATIPKIKVNSKEKRDDHNQERPLFYPKQRGSSVVRQRN